MTKNMGWGVVINVAKKKKIKNRKDYELRNWYFAATFKHKITQAKLERKFVEILSKIRNLISGIIKDNSFINQFARVFMGTVIRATRTRRSKKFRIWQNSIV